MWLLMGANVTCGILLILAEGKLHLVVIAVQGAFCVLFCSASRSVTFPTRPVPCDWHPNTNKHGHSLCHLCHLSTKGKARHDDHDACPRVSAFPAIINAISIQPPE